MHIHKKFNILFTREGTCQAERLLPELVDNKLLVSDKQLSDHLRFLYLYTDLLAYYDLNNKQIKGNMWRQFLEQDDTVIRSLILHTDIDKVKKNIHKEFLLLRSKPAEIIVDTTAIVHILTVAQDLIILLNYWHKNLPNKDSIRAKLDAVIHEEINIHISRIYHVLQSYHKINDFQPFMDFCLFLEEQCHRSTLWALTIDVLFHANELSKTAMRGMLVIDSLDDFFDAIFNTISQLKELSAGDYFDTLALQSKQPHMALLIAFLQLLQHADDCLNVIPERSLEHYYRHILKFNNNPSIPDQAYVHFLLNADYPFAFIPQRSRLVAKNPVNDEEIIFETTRNITINKAKIKQINVLSTTQAFNKVGHKSTVLSTATYCGASLKELPFQLFPALPDHRAQCCQQMAIVIGSPLLYLAEGVRTIHITWYFTAETFQELVDKNTNKALSTETFLTQLVENVTTMAQLQITTKAGWFALAEEAIAFAFIQENQSLHMTVVLTPDVPAIECLSNDYQGKIVNPATPALAIGISDDIPQIGPYLCNKLTLEKIDLQVNVQGYRGLILQNQLGLIDNSQVIEPFGPFPKIDSSFYIGSGEVFSKNLTDLKINIKWEAIPSLEGGFKRYYGAYPIKVNNDDFKVTIAYLNHQHWYPSSRQQRQSIPLFQVIKYNQGSERLDIHRTIDDIDIAMLDITKTNQPLEVVVYGPKTTAGFLKLQLSGPDQAFGHAIYPSLIKNVWEQNTQKQREEPAILLNEPYTPRIKSITLDYEARESILFDLPPGEEQERYPNTFFHISSFGHSKIFPGTLNFPVHFLPLLEEEEAFIAFGLESLNSNTLSMHVAIGDNAWYTDQQIKPPVWFYLSNNHWFPLKEAIIVDGTVGCTKSGIVIFDLGNLSIQPTTTNTHMPPGLIWIKAQFTASMDKLMPIVGAYTQAVVVSRVLDKNGVFAAPTLPANAIVQLQQPIDGIEAVVQPFRTFGGRQFENHQAFYRRVSERLRHKNRAISAWDYEHIVLENFPEILRVKCINHTVKHMNSMVQPGHITLVVIAKRSAVEVGKFPIVRTDTLAAIKEYLQRVSAPYVQCEVVNPFYEDVKIHVAVKFKTGYEKGLFLNFLQQDLRNFLSPWLFDTSVDIRLGGKLPISKVIDFINSRHYIDGIGNFSIFKYVGKAPHLKLDKVADYDGYLSASYPWSVMVSAQDHNISAVDQLDAVIKLRHGSIGDMAISEDFIIGPLEVPYEQEDTIHVYDNVPLSSLEEHHLVASKYIKTDYGSYQ